MKQCKMRNSGKKTQKCFDAAADMSVLQTELVYKKVGFATPFARRAPGKVQKWNGDYRLVTDHHCERCLGVLFEKLKERVAVEKGRADVEALLSSVME